jgi:putative hydroxymethylpyrimidine transport system permease protein
VFSTARALLVFSGLLLIWQLIVSGTGAPDYILPGPLKVLAAFGTHYDSLIENSLITFSEIIAGLVLGTLLGFLSALLMVLWRKTESWLLPVLVVSQALPVFAIAPVLVLWLGYGAASKIAMAILIIFFPVTAALHDGLKRADQGWLDLARVMGASNRRTLLLIRLPAAMPAFGSGLRVAAAVAPIGAIVGEWVGSSAGLGYLMLHANARLQIEVMFAALLILAIFSCILYFSIDGLLRRYIRW